MDTDTSRSGGERRPAPEPYLAFLRRLERGQVVTLPLDPGERPRAVVRTLNLAAARLGMRLARLPDPPGTVRFRVVASPTAASPGPASPAGAAGRPPARPGPPGPGRGSD
ncbi:MAG TPA: hypothetical protein VHQ00_05240 [Chloroflexota bacterium]|nr:hypothetical protein [Chloroflexota bacterium]